MKKRGIDLAYKYDKDFDFFPCTTYDYLITGNDPLGDKEIFQSIDYKLMGLRRDRENPDLLFVIAKNADESINTTYVPPSYRTVNVGSKTTSSYNGLTRQYEYRTKQNSYTVKEGDYTKETKVQDLYLEITILDAKRLNDKSQTTPPIVWQAVFKQHLTNANISPSKQFNAFSSWTPVITPMRYLMFDSITRNKSVWLQDYCIEMTKDSVDIIKAIPEWSLVKEYGLLPGDKLLEIELTVFYKRKKFSKNTISSSRRKTFIENGWELLNWLDYGNYSECTILRNGEKITFHIPPKPEFEIIWYYFNPCPDQ